MFPTLAEITEICKTMKCQKCKKNNAEPMSIAGCWSVGPCGECKEKESLESRNKPKRKGKILTNPNRVFSVWEHPSGAQIPVNENGDVISPVHADYERKPGEKPLW